MKYVFSNMGNKYLLLSCFRIFFIFKNKLICCFFILMIDRSEIKMFRMNFTVVFLNVYFITNVVYGAQIFAFVPIYGQSHWNVMDAVLQTLVSAGHNVTVITPFIKKEKIENYTQIDSSFYMTRSASAPFKRVAGSDGIQYLMKTHLTACEAIYKRKDFWTVLESKKYDLFVTQLLGSGCDSLNGEFGNPLITSYTSTLNVALASPKIFWDRFLNTYDYLHSISKSWWYNREATVIGRNYFGKDVPDSYTLMEKISLVFINSHFSFNLPRPWVPNLIEIGGIHVTDPKPLPKDIQLFIDNAPEGVIYFSFGSTVKMDSLPTKMQISLQEAFAELPQRILWKYDGEVMENQPNNVMIKKWFPQRDIMAHSKLKLFIYHGGLSGINEAIINQVPILGIPLFSDQYRNMVNAVFMGMGLSLDYKTLDKQSVLTAAKEIINNKKYKQNVKKLYQTFKDRPMSPNALVTYWTNYVINHNGTEHMNSASNKMIWYQYHNLDIILIIILVSIIINDKWYQLSMVSRESPDP
ncbi:hypothetical protein AGLY_012549 [Aphis glycines]|uniref:UDP-glycosyltransferases domain-containing protein n=1 Tax=Aphis glycines TaxID=307491 RepID=A0A6G0T8P7_APHGL|nr:hypothetical protein AGLY_012549 [Aphis glycines]